MIMKNLVRNIAILLLGLSLLAGCVPAQGPIEPASESASVDLSGVQSGLMSQATSHYQSITPAYHKARSVRRVRLMNPQVLAPELINYEDVEIFASTDPCFDWLNATAEEREHLPQALIDECESRFLESIHAYAEHGDPTPLQGEDEPIDHGDPTPLSTDPTDDPAGHGDPTPLDGGGETQ